MPRFELCTAGQTIDVASVQQAKQALDGLVTGGFLSMSLLDGDEAILDVCCVGPGTYYVTAQPVDALGHFTLVDAAKEASLIEVVVLGNSQKLPENHLTGLALAQQAVCQFATDGKLSVDVNWEEYQTG